MADELRRKCGDPRCGRSFASYANLVLHERTAHLPADILRQFAPVQAENIEHQAEEYCAGVVNGSELVESTELNTRIQNSFVNDFDAGVNKDLSDDTSHCLRLPSDNTEDMSDCPAFRAEEDPELLNFNLTSVRYTDDLLDESLPRDLHLFYKSFNDSSEVLLENVSELVPKLEDLPQPCQEIIKDCMRRRMSQGDIHYQYKLMARLERLSPCSGTQQNGNSVSTLTGTFESGKKFVERVVRERKLLIKSQRWRLAVLKNSLGISKYGVFLPIMVVLDRIVREAGGIESIIEPVDSRDSEGNRLFSSPIDSDVVRTESKCTGSGSFKRYRKLFFSIYCDETLLSKSGSQDAAVIRIRADNVKGMNTEWFDVGIPPKLQVGSGSISEGKKRAAKLDLLHRFLFLILEDISYPNHNLTVQSYGFEPCLLGFVVDQPQEREFCCLKRGNCEQDCSVCCFKSTQDRENRKKTREYLTNSRHHNPGDKRQRPASSHRVCDDDLYGSDLGFDYTEGEASDATSCGSPDRTESMPLPHLIQQYENRNTTRTVRLQLQAAVERRRRTKESSFTLKGINAVLPGQLSKTISEELYKQSALPFPPVFGCLKGICNGPSRLYTLPTIDILHCFDLGPSKQFCDNAFHVLQRASYGGPSGRSKLVRLLNQRVADLSGDTEVRGLRPFKTVESDRQASYSGKQRRLLCPVLWSVVPGLTRKLPPDEDPLYIVALSLDEMQAELRGINRSVSSRMRTSEEIDLLQGKCRTACNRFISCFDVNETTKLHRFMVHVGAHLRAFGNLRMSDTGRNESLHRGVKESYRATNKHLKEIGPQLLQVNISAELSRTPTISPAVSHLLLTRDPPATDQAKFMGRRVRRNWDNATRNQKDNLVAREMNSLVVDVKRSLGTHASIAAIVKRISGSVDGFDRLKYKRKYKMTIAASFEWVNSEDVYVRQTLHAIRSNGFCRQDSVRYETETGIDFGQIEAFYERRPTIRETDYAGGIVAVLRKLIEVEPDPGNERVVLQFGYKRLGYEFIDADVELVVVPLSKISRRIVLVRDMWDVCCCYGPTIRIGPIKDTQEERRLARFFEAKNVKFTSIGEEVLYA